MSKNKKTFLCHPFKYLEPVLCLLQINKIQSLVEQTFQKKNFPDF